MLRLVPGMDGKQQCACACSMVFRTELHLQSLSTSETRRQFGVFFVTRVDVLLSHKQIKWWRLFSPLDIGDLFSFEDLNILVPVFPECVKEDHFLLLYRRTERKQVKQKMNSQGGDLVYYPCVCVCVREVWWMSVWTGTPGWTEHKGQFSRWVPGPKDEDTHLAEILSDSKTTGFWISHFAPRGVNIGIGLKHSNKL